MAQANGVPETDPLKSWREARSAAMASWAKLALSVTSSDAYSRMSSLVAKPGLVAAGLFRKEAEKAMALFLAHANMPSRADVLALSTRLTHIEMALDDLAAAVDELRGRSAPPRPAKKAPAGRAGRAKEQ